jgi:UDP-GlcNAc:undecaprenyl-phosphate/decaprenyl-phosphate GlcNAc-1-phosphate transferase
VVVLLFISALASCVIAIFLIRYFSDHAEAYSIENPQRFHKGHIPRVGGVAIFLALACGLLLSVWLPKLGVSVNSQTTMPQNVYFLLCLTPIFFAGLYEDLTQKLSVKLRLLFSIATAALACYFLDLSIPRLEIAGFDYLIAHIPITGVLLAGVAIAGLPHAFNIIDGYNGLAATVTLFICAAVAHVALLLGDRSLASCMMITFGSTLGFLIWNYPRGLIFAGDSGAYIWGATIAICLIALVQRHPTVSPWFAMLLLIYPVWETLFSIYRKLARGSSPGVADSLHFHQLIYRRIVRSVFHDSETRRMLMRNNRTSPYLWGFTALTVIPAVLFWNNTLILIIFCIIFIFTYISAYLMIIRFKVPSWLRR